MTTRRTRKRSANRLPTRSAGSNERGGDVSPGATMPARYRLTPIRGPHSGRPRVCRSRSPPGIMEPVTEANIDAAHARRQDDRRPPARTPRKRMTRRRIDKVTLALSLVIAVGLVLIGRGLAVSLTGDDRANLPDDDRERRAVPGGGAGAQPDPRVRRPRGRLHGRARDRRRRAPDDRHRRPGPAVRRRAGPADRPSGHHHLRAGQLHAHVHAERRGAGQEVRRPVCTAPRSSTGRSPRAASARSATAGRSHVV